MDRFIARYEVKALEAYEDLKSNMDRFIDTCMSVTRLTASI